MVTYSIKLVPVPGEASAPPPKIPRVISARTLGQSLLVTLILPKSDAPPPDEIVI